jgi:monoterpene epsilon-lactone hydrolase
MTDDVVKQMYDRWARGEGQGDDSWGDLTTEPGDVDYREVDAAGVSAMWIDPHDAARDKVIVALHGGGFAGGSFNTHRKLYGHLAKAAGTRSLLVHYRLTPEHAYPAQLEDAVTAYRWVVEQGLTTVLAGDSSGGGLCVTATLRIGELGLPAPAALLLISPWVDMELTGTSYESNAGTDLVFTRSMVQSLADLYLSGGASAKDPLTNPLYADLAGLPPTFVQVGRDEALLEDSRMLAERAREAGVLVRLDEFPGQLHTFQMAAGRTAVADDAIGRFAEWLRPTF